MIKFIKQTGLFFVSLYLWIVLFVMAFLVLVTGLLLLFVSNARVVFRTVRAMLRFMFKIMFVKVDVEYPDNFDFNKSYIIMPNHITFWDIPVICSVLPNYTFGIEAESHFSWPIYGFFIKKYGTLPINRKNILASFRTFETAAQKMKEKNASLLVFPEGHRSDDGNIQEFKKIPFKMAQIVKVPILPCGTSGLGKLAPKGFFVKPGRVKIKYGTPIPVEEYGDLRPEEAAKMVRQRVIELSEDDIVPENEKKLL